MEPKEESNLKELEREAKKLFKNGKYIIDPNPAKAEEYTPSLAFPSILFKYIVY